MNSYIRKYYQTFNTGDREALLAMLHPGVIHEINEGGVEVGIPAFRAFLSRMDRCYHEQVEDLVIFSSQEGNRAAAEFFIRGEYLVSDEGLPPANGQKYHIRVGAFFEIQSDLVYRISNYYNLSAWINMVGG